MPRSVPFAAIVVLFFTVHAHSQDLLPRLPPRVPAEAIASFRLLEGFRLELLAAEPLVTDPVAMAYDENGLAYVVEMNDYPYSHPTEDKAWEDQKSAPLGRVRVLEDVDGDGVFDSSTVFAQELSWPTGIVLWKGGAFVTATPDIWYFKDTDGDRMADVRQKVFTGFRKFNVQAVINNPQWGLDHKIYAAGSSNGGVIRPGNMSDAASVGLPRGVTLGRNDFRIDPVTNSFEVLSGGARFGNSFDDWGERFICNIRNPVQHIVLDDHYFLRNPGLAVRTAVHDAAEAGDALPVFRISPPEPWRVLNASRLAAAARGGTPRSEMHAVGYVTSACGLTIYRGAAYPEEFDGNAFVAEVAGNLVIRYRLEPDGATFRAVRTHQHEEFLASTDNWFRPVNFINAPDGTLHLLDMYRETIEHPWSLPDDIKAELDLRSGHDRGRIYRLVPAKYREGFQPPGRPALGRAGTLALVAALENANSWWRETAHRLLYERQDAAAVPALRTMLAGSPSAVARLHALHSLAGLSSLADGDLEGALRDASPRVREHAIRLAESRLASSATLKQRVLELAADHDARVRMQAALSLGAAVDETVVTALRALLQQDVADPWLRTAVLCSLPSDAVPGLLQDWLHDPRLNESAAVQGLAEQLLTMLVSRRQPSELQGALSLLLTDPRLVNGDAVVFDGSLFRLLLGLCERLMAAGLQPAQLDLESAARRRFGLVMEAAARAARDQDQSPAVRVACLRFIACGPVEPALAVLDDLFDVRHPQEVQLAAADALGRFRDPRVTDLFLSRYRQLTPAVRENVVVLLLSQTDRSRRLLEAIKAGAVPANDVPPVRRSLLTRSSDDAIRTQAQTLFGGERTSEERRQLLATYREALGGDAQPKQGEAVFRRDCINCHRLGNEGQDVGPGLATIRGRIPGEVLEHVLDPNREVSPQYLEYVVVTRDGVIKTGIIDSETPTSITLRQSGGKQETVLRADIDEMTGSGKSLMPEGFEKKITPGEMVDLIAFLLSGPSP
jgi:putative membrane-bound dehydrogenase-like protein